MFMRGSVYLLAILLVGAVLASPVEKLSPELRGIAQNTDPGDFIPVLVKLTDPPDMSARLQEIRELPKFYRRSATRKYFKDVFAATAPPFERFLNSQTGWRNLRELYSANAFTVDVVPVLLYKIAGRGDVVMIISNRERNMLLKSPDRDLWRSAPRGEGAFHTAVSDALAPMSVTWDVAMLRANDVWGEGYNGDGVLVSVIDTGINWNHHDLQSRIWTNPGEVPGNGVDDDGNGKVDDVHGYDFYNDDGDPMDDASGAHYHGTFCASCVAGDGTAGNNTGTAPGAQVMACKVLSATGVGSMGDVIDAVQYSVDNGADVLSMSFGFPASDDYTEVVMRYYMVGYCYSSGVTAVVAAGNGDNSGGHYALPNDISCPGDVPAAWYGSSSDKGPVLCIGALDYDSTYASYSSYGPTKWDTGTHSGISYNDYPYPPGLMKPDLASPGTDVIGADGRSVTNYVYETGTSAATPLAAGVVALMLSKNSSLELAAIDSILETTAVDIYIPGRDNHTGAGLIDAYAAVSAVTSPDIWVDSVWFEDTYDGDSRLDRGETDIMRVRLMNKDITAKTSVTLSVSETDPYITLPDNSAYYGTIAARTTATNTSDPISVQVSSSCPIGERIVFMLHITADGGYGKDDSLIVRINTGPWIIAAIDTGQLYYLISNFGLYGYYPYTNTGLLYPWPAETINTLYLAELMIGQSDAYVANGGDDFFPTETLTVYPGTTTDQESYTTFIDSTNYYYVRQSHYVNTAAPDNDFVIVHNRIHNWSGVALSGVMIGVFYDFDIDDYPSDRGAYSSSDGWIYMYGDGDPYCGLVGITTPARGSMVNNPTYVYADGGMGWTDSVKWGFLSGTYNEPTASTPDDWAVVLSFGPYAIPAGGDVDFSYAVVCGHSLSEFQTNAAEAKSFASSLTLSVDEKKELPDGFALIGSYPNPFNSRCQIRFISGRGGRVLFSVWDIAGHIVEYRSVDAARGVNTLSFVGDALPSGVYLYRVEMNGQRLDGRMMLAR